ncbi:hypothetical protein [Picosynechococcus sp. PCC 7117]|uniref:hypothetical protein n=1 Tax=Picosynechococcus sp. PCC 7117 TaxID=195498 RepID=UPI0008109406|nr:hypothetical protein [Picosynechococcus sp. PCC 7117]ANV87361.1 hypothetical protein AWQ22_07775 [Picosynechococcus sp. PCC 7117]
MGAYHGLNVGDMSMGISVKKIAHRLGLKVQLKKVVSCSSKKHKFILGGGAIFSPKNLEIIMLNTDNNPSRIAILGVDFHPNHNDLTIQYLRGATFLGSRSFSTEKDKKIIFSKFQRHDIVWHPDLTFAFYPLLPPP